MRKKISVDPGQLFSSESTLFSNVKHCNISLTVLSRWRTMCKKKQNMFESVISGMDYQSKILIHFTDFIKIWQADLHSGC